MRHSSSHPNLLGKILHFCFVSLLQTGCIFLYFAIQNVLWLTYHTYGFINQLVNRNSLDFLFVVFFFFSGASYVILGRSLEIVFRDVLNSRKLIPLWVCVLASRDVISQSLNGNSNNVIPQRDVIKVNMFMTESDMSNARIV